LRRSLPSDPSKPIQIDLLINQSGAFEVRSSRCSVRAHLTACQFYVEHEASALQSDLPDQDDVARPHRTQSKHCYFNVDPVLYTPARSPILDSQSHRPLPVGKGGVVQAGSLQPVTLDALVIQSVIGKWMGPLRDWPAHLANVRDRGYNMLHFTPLQERGESNSPYSIYDQLSFSPDLFDRKGLSSEERTKEMTTELRRLNTEMGLLSMTDVVWNHTANNSPWLDAHPDAGYNVDNSPHLAAALELDDALVDLSVHLDKYGLRATVETVADLDAIMRVLEDRILPALQLWQYYVIDIDQAKAAFASAKSEGGARLPVEVNLRDGVSREDKLALFAKYCLPKHWDTLGGRYKAKVDGATATAFADTEDELVGLVNDLNVDRYALFDNDRRAILLNTRNRIQYQRIDAHGPQMRTLSRQAPLTDNYFTHLPCGVAVANNGWMWDADPLLDFASSKSRAYLRREVIGWGDCVKLRYGSGPDDSPFLWSHMTQYTELMASIFDGFRIDNCHSTPVHVGEALLDAARRVKHNLYVCAELFTGSEELDIYFVSRLGLNSLIREAMNGHDPKDESRLLYSYGLGKPVGSMDGDCLTQYGTITLDGQEPRPCIIEQHQGSTPHAFMMDCTHDNESPADKRTAEDALATGALVTMAWSAVGSNKGFDDLYPKLLNLVTESRHYEVYDSPDDSGIGAMKRILNHLHTEMALQGYKEGHLHQENDVRASNRVRCFDLRLLSISLRTGCTPSLIAAT
jgi:glycogen debranching enzyme